METRPGIELKNAAIGYKKNKGELVLTRDINLSFYPGDFIGIAGLNGVGKSTFLKSIAGLLPLLEGEILIEGDHLSGMSLQKLATRVAIVLTEKVGGFNLTAFDAVAAGQIPYTNSFHQLRDAHLSAISKAIAACRLEGQEHKKLQELSDGLYQKTMIAKGLSQQTPILLLDEPSAFLDYASKHELFILLRRLAQEEKKCVLVSTHDLDLALKYCGKILVFSENGIELTAATSALKNSAFARIAGGYI
jgi:iron complex transport system ATP-binding protein